ncbi:MAG: translocation/assembly module TamB domain-containing protein, partial [Bacteroidaceae bacterium]|nr:translocation/assembly module TamB domain-containing protein [Bacteroidaceae bacterium]
WKELRQAHFYGSLQTVSQLRLPAAGGFKGLDLTTSILPSTMVIDTREWAVEPGQITLHDGQLNITKVALTHADQHLTISGAYAQHSEGLAIDLNKVDVGSAIALTGFDDVTFGGQATGRGILRPSPDGYPVLEAELSIPNFHFNHHPLGEAIVRGGFDGHESTILLNADIREPRLSHTEVNGYVSLGRKELDLKVRSENTSLAFLNQYTDGIFERLEGRATGYCRVFGDFKHIDFEGYERGSATARVPVTGVTYHVDNADVTILPGEFRLDRADISDRIKGSGQVSGALKHQHLRHMTYDFRMTGSDIKLYDRPYEVDMPFFATAYGSGNVHLFGGPGAMTANIKVTTDPRATLTYVLDSPDATDQSLVTFQAAQPEASMADSFAVQLPAAATAARADDSPTSIRLNMDVTVDPTSTLKMITDFKSGDIITVHGSGPIQASYYNKGSFQMFGTYQIERGEYDLSIQNVIKKTFTLLPGGTVNFSGNPQDADVNVRASYTVNSASLADLNIGSGFANNTTPVNCLVNFTGHMSNMHLTLDFDLPNVSEDEKMMVRNLIASEEDRTMQVLYLLGVGRFFTYNYASTESAAGQSQSTVMMKSLLTSTLSSQINNIIANAVGASNWTFGANVATGQLGWQDMEVDGSLSGRLLNNRLVVNGKVGYHERQAATTNFVGDFDVHYLITPSGSINLKAYSETNDRYFTKSALTTQGVGIQFKRDFNSLRDLFKRRSKGKKTPDPASNKNNRQR